ncbi:MAG: TIR domain-containing protein, partial [Chloroflexia bacterium]
MKGGYYFISHSVADGREFAQRLAEQLEHASPPVRVWLDKRPPGDLDAAGGRLRPGYDWDAQMDEAIRRCDGVLFVMTRDSVRDTSVCKLEWGTALQFKKLVIPLRLHRDAAMPFGLGRRQYHDFSGDFDQALRELRDHFEWMASPEGLLFELRVMLADAERDLDRARDEPARTRVQADIDSLRDRIAEQERIVADPEAAQRETERRVERGLEEQRTPAPAPRAGDARVRFINPPPALAPTYFQNRTVETGLVADWLADDSVRLVTVTGRAGIGKTSLVCRLLKAMETGRLPDGGELDVDGIVYLTARGSRSVAFLNLYTDLLKLLPTQTSDQLDALYKDPHVGAGQKMQALCEAFPEGRVVVLLDNFEDALDPESLAVHDAELDEGLRALLRLPQHGIKVVMTTRYAPPSLMLVEPGRQRRLDLEEGLASPYAENILREMDADGKLGLKTAPNSLLDD